MSDKEYNYEEKYQTKKLIEKPKITSEGITRKLVNLFAAERSGCRIDVEPAKSVYALPV